MQNEIIYFILTTFLIQNEYIDVFFLWNFKLVEKIVYRDYLETDFRNREDNMLTETENKDLIFQ